MSTEIQGMSEERLREIELTPDGPSPLHSRIISELVREVWRLQQRERDLQTAVQLNEGLIEGREHDYKRGYRDGYDTCWHENEGNHA